MTGVLAGYEDATGADVRRCRRFVGTSAGSIVVAGRSPRRPGSAKAGAIAGELQRDGGGQELHQQGGSRSLEEHDRIVLAQVGERFGADMRCNREQRRHCGSTARRAAAASVAGVAPGAWLRHVSDETGQSAQPEALGLALLPPLTKTARSCSRRRARCGAGTLAEAHPVRPAMRATTHVEGKAIRSSRGRRRAARWMSTIAEVGLDGADVDSELVVAGRRRATVLAAGVSARMDVDDGGGVVFVVGLRMAPARRAGER